MPTLLTEVEEPISHYYDWISHQARPNQVPPPGEWFTWLLLAGRGFGKTRTAAEDVAYYGITHPGARIAVIAETFGDARDICFEGDAGLLSVLPESIIKAWNRSLGQLILKTGAQYDTYAGDKPDQLRGPSHHRAWCDELAKFRYARETWDMLMFGLRLRYQWPNGVIEDPQAVVTTTPKPITVLKEILAEPSTVISSGSTYENIDNLSARFREVVLRRYEGTRLGRQELHAELLEDVPGALWSRDMIRTIDPATLPEMSRVLVSIDPAVTSGEDSDETGIIVAGKGVDGRGYVLADRTCRLSPDGWANRAVIAYDEFEADRIVAEINNGGDLVENTLRTVDHNIPYTAVRASRGKRVRAEPVAALYEQGRVDHVPGLNDLEDQMVAFTPEGTDESPDHVDAMVWALTELMVEKEFEPLIARA